MDERTTLHRDASIPLTYVVVDVLRCDALDLTSKPSSERRSVLESLALEGRHWSTAETFVDGRALFTGVCDLGLEGVIAKKHSSLYRPNDRGWVKPKNPNYWRRDAEREAMTRKREHRAFSCV